MNLYYFSTSILEIMNYKNLFLANAVILLPQLALAQSTELKALYQKTYGETTPRTVSDKVPNILFITSDQHHWMAMGYNDPKCKTPNLDNWHNMV